jgi:hypothetical protein
MSFDRKSKSVRLAVVPVVGHEFFESRSAPSNIQYEPAQFDAGSIEQAKDVAPEKISLTDPSVMIAFMLVDAIVVFLGSILSWFIYHQIAGSDLPNWWLYVRSAGGFAMIFVANGLRGTSYGFLWGVERS